MSPNKIQNFLSVSAAHISDECDTHPPLFVVGSPPDFPDSIKIIRYEDLIQSPEKEKIEILTAEKEILARAGLMQ